MPESVLEAIRQGQWDYEPEVAERPLHSATNALPGSKQKLDILADRIEQGLPLWHPEDRLTYENLEQDD